MTEHLQDAYNSIKDRFKNSFILTFLIVWSALHWELIYTILNFDSGENRISKVAFISSYIKTHSMIWIPLCNSIISLVIVYIVFIFSDVIHSFYNVIRNAVLSAIKSKKVIRIEEYNRIGKELDRIRARAGDFQRKETEYILSKEDLEKDVTELSISNEQMKGQLSENTEKLKTLNNLMDELTVAKSSIEKLKGDLADKAHELSKSIESNKEKDTVILNTKLTATKLQLDNEIKSTFQVWADSEVPQLSNNWLNLTDREKERFTETFYKYKEFKELFGYDSWVINSNDKQFRFYNITITLTNNIKPTFVTKDNIVLEVKRIIFNDKDNLQFILGVLNVAHDYIINLKIKSKNKYEGMSSGTEIEFNRIVSTKNL